MSRYERQKVEVSSLQEGDIFELPRRAETIVKVSSHRLRREEDGSMLGIIGYDIVEGPLHWPFIYLPHDYKVTLLLPTTTYVALSGRDFVEALKEQHGVEP